MSLWVQIPIIFLIIYLFMGLVIAIVRITAHDMPWPLFVFTIIFWPTLWL